MAAKTTSTAAPKQKICGETVKVNGERKLCKTIYPNKQFATCPNRSKHVTKYRTGFCIDKHCEGTKPKSWRGVPMMTCKFFDTCPCKCHDDLDFLFRMSGKDRVEAVPNPEWKPAPRQFWLPSDEDIVTRPISSDADTPAPRRIESPAPDLVPATVVHTFAPTASGRAARGELESWVKTQCDVWLVEGYSILCTPSWIADEIADDQGIKPPSVGAISAIFDRWVKLGFAVIEKKPTRFTSYTEDGIKMGLDGMKARAKRQRDLATAAQKRGTLR